MEIFNLTVPANKYLGHRADYTKSEEELTYYIAANDLVAAQRVAVEVIGLKPANAIVTA